MVNLRAGYSLVEVVIVAGLVGLVAAVVIPNFGSLNSRLASDLLAHDIGLAIRGAQADALNGRTYAGGPKAAYGISVSSEIGNNKQIVQFYDANDSGSYEAGTDGLVATSEFQNRSTISRVCRMKAGEAMACGVVSKLDIVFKRPDPDAMMEGDGGAGSENSYVEAGILLLSSDGTLEKCVHIYSTGQIAITNGAGDGTTCP